MKVTVYLAGQMGPKPANMAENPTTSWRDKFHKAIAYNPMEQPIAGWKRNITILDPTEGEAFASDVPPEQAMAAAYANWKGSLILSKDREMVKQCNVLVANLNHYLKEKMILGTIYELAWAYDDPSTTVIIIADPELAPMAKHPFVKGTVGGPTSIVATVEEAIEQVCWLGGSAAGDR